VGEKFADRAGAQIQDLSEAARECSGVV